MAVDAVSAVYAFDIISNFDIHKPERLNTLFRKYGDQGLSAFNLIKSLGFETPVKQDIYGHNEELRIHENFKVNAIVADPGVGNDIAVVLHPDSLDGSNRFYPRLDDNVIFPNEVTGYVQDIDISTPTAPVLTLRLQDDTDNWGALAAGDFLIIHSGSSSEKAGQPAGAVSGTFYYENECQIIKETIDMSGSEMVRQTWIPIMSNGKSIPSFTFKGLLDIDYRMALKVDGALLFNKRTTNAAAIDPTTNNPYQTTEGIIPYTRRVGKVLPYTPGVGGFDVDDFDTADRLLDTENSGNYIMNLLGINLHQTVENSLFEYFKDTNIIYAKETTNTDLFGGSASLAASVNFKMLTKAERTHMFKRMKNFSYAKTFGTTGYNMRNQGLMLPINKRKDPVTHDQVASVGCRYRALGQYSRKMEVWDVGGAGSGLKVTEFDKRSTYQRCHVGAHFRGGNAFILIDPSL